MHYDGQLTWAGILSGCLGGMFKFFLQVHNTPFLINVMGAAFTALLCGAAGVAGKEMYVVIKKHIKTKYLSK